MSNAKEMPVTAAATSEQARAEESVNSTVDYSTDSATLQEENSSGRGRRHTYRSLRRGSARTPGETGTNPPAPEAAATTSNAVKDAQKERMRIETAARFVGLDNVLMERPGFVLVKDKRDKDTGEVEKVESVQCNLLAQTIRESEHYKFVKIPGVKTPLRFWYGNGVYNEVFEDEIMGRVKRRIDAWNPCLTRMKDVEEVFKLLKTDEQFVDEAAKDAEELVVNFKNGLFYPMTWELKPHDPRVFSTRQLPFDFPIDALKSGFMFDDKAPVFLRFMERFCCGASGKHPDGVNRWTCLMEWMAVILSNVKSSHIKKSLWVYGDGDSGKSQLLSLIRYLLGRENCHATDLEQLEARFGTAPIYNKRLVCSPDQKFFNAKELSVFKTLVGAGDPVNLERKGRDSFTYDFDGFVWLCMNRLPKFGGDMGTHVFDRMILFKAPETVPESERDGELLNKLKSEAPYLVPLILSYLPQVVRHGYKLTEPLETEQARKMYSVQNDPVQVWLSECCVDVQKPRDEAEAATVELWRRSANKLTVNEMYKHYKAWCKAYENGYSQKRDEWKQHLKDVSGNPDISDRDFFLIRNGRKVLARYCLNAAALEEYERNSFMY